jgi:signal recognition particle subunit SRP72
VHQSSPEHPDILTNLSATTAHRDFDAHGYHQHLSGPASGTGENRIPTDGDLETYVPGLPTGWAVGGVEGVKKVAPVKAVTKEKVEAKKGKTRHRLPKGAVVGKPFTEDVSATYTKGVLC